MVELPNGLVKTLAQALMKNFVCRGDCYAVQQSDGQYFRIEKPLTLQKISKQHFNGITTLGPYQLSKDNRVKFCTHDLDPEKLEDPLATAKRILAVCLEEGEYKQSRIWRRAILLEASRYPDPSYHLWILFEPSVPAKVARWLGLRILELANVNPKIVEVFPKQTELTQDRPYGNLVKLPLGLHQVEKKWSKFLDLETFEPLPPTCMFNVEGVSFSEEDLTKIMGFGEKKAVQTKFELPKNFKPLADEDEEKAARFLVKYWKLGYRNQLELSFLGWAIKRGISHESALRIICEVVERTRDEEKAARLSLVDYHYRNRVNNITNLKGISGLREIVTELV